MRKKLEKTRSILAELKVNISRSMSYVAIVNSGMILFLLLSRLENYNIDINLSVWFLPLFLLSIIGMIIVGYIDNKIGMHHEEQRVSNTRNPHMMDIITRLERIEEKLK